MATNIITQKEFAQLVVFPRSNLVKGYDDLKEKIFDVLIKPEFQTFLEDKYFVSEWYESSKTQSERNISFRSGILSLLNYQYSFKLAYTIYSIQTDGPYFFYSYKNYIPIFTIFSELNKNVLNQLISSLKNQQQQLTNVTAPFETIACILTIVYFVYLFKERQLKNKLINLLCNQNFQVVQYEIQRLYILQNKIQTHSQILYRYRLDLIEFDQNLKIQEKEYQKIISSHGQKLSQKKGRSNVKLYSIAEFIILFINFAIYCLLLFFTLSSLNAYIVKMQNTAVIYQELSNSGVDVLIVHAQREVLYRRANIIFFKPQDVEDLLDQVDNSLKSIKEISAQLLKINQDEYLLDDSSFQLFQSVNSDSLCQYLPQEFQAQATTLCPQVLGGVLQQGLISTFQYMYNKIYQEKQINNFTLRNNSQVPIKELEGATFTAKVIKQLVNSLYVNLQNQTNLLRNNFTIIFTLFIILSTIISGIIVIKFNEIEKKQINYLRKVVYILPQSIQIFDDSYLRQIKNLIRMTGLV